MLILIPIPILQIKKINFKYTKSVAQGHVASGRKIKTECKQHPDSKTYTLFWNTF